MATNSGSPFSDAYFEIVAIRTIKEYRRKTLRTIVAKCAARGVDRQDLDRIVDETPALLPDSFVKRWLKARQDAQPDETTEKTGTTETTTDAATDAKTGTTTPAKKKSGGQIDLEKARRVVEYYDKNPRATLTEIARAVGIRRETVKRTLKRERGFKEFKRFTLAEKRALALDYFNKRPDATIEQAARALGYKINPCQVFQRFGAGPWDSQIAERREARRRYVEGVCQATEERFVKTVFDPENPIRPYTESSYRDSLMEGYNGFFYVGETWSRYIEIYEHKRRGESIQIDKDGAIRWSSHGINGGRNRIPKDNAPRVFSLSVVNS